MKFFRRFAYSILLLLVLILGVLLGGYLFSDTQPRAFLALQSCGSNCLKKDQVLGLLGSVLVQKQPGLLPEVIYETNKSIAINYPVAHKGDHFVIIPKRDIKNIGDIREGDQDALIDVFNVIGHIVREKKMHGYRIITYGPGRQDIAYLHFHLVGQGAN